MKTSVLVCVFLVAVPLTGVLAGDAPIVLPQPQRVEVFSPDGTRQGHVRIDQQTGHIEGFDQHSNRLGWGKIRPDGQEELFDVGASPGHRAPRRTSAAAALSYRPMHLEMVR